MLGKQGCYYGTGEKVKSIFVSSSLLVSLSERNYISNSALQITAVIVIGVRLYIATFLLYNNNMPDLFISNKLPFDRQHTVIKYTNYRHILGLSDWTNALKFAPDT